MTERPVDILYFAWIREMVGQDEERLELPPHVTTAGELLNLLANRGNGYATAFHDRGKVRVAVNQDHVDMDHALTPGDEVAFFPPVTGG
jgi:molybdopterin synthase sulfur carrier subunit